MARITVGLIEKCSDCGEEFVVVGEAKFCDECQTLLDQKFKKQITAKVQAAKTEQGERKQTRQRKNNKPKRNNNKFVIEA